MFDSQIAHLLVDRYIIEYTQNKIAYHQKCKSQYSNSAPTANNEIMQSTHMATKFEVIITRNEVNKKIEVKSQWSTGPQKGETVLSSILQLIVTLHFKKLPLYTQHLGVHIYGFTEYCREKVTFRAHPNYRNEGPWYDYVLIAWNQQNAVNQYSDNDSMQETLDMPVKTDDHESTSNAVLIPAKVLCFIKGNDNEIMAIIHSCLQTTKKKSVLTYQWQLEYKENQNSDGKQTPYDDSDNASKLTPIYHIVSVDTFQKNVLMIPNHRESQFLMEIIDQSKWGKAFM